LRRVEEFGARAMLANARGFVCPASQVARQGAQAFPRFNATLHVPGGLIGTGDDFSKEYPT
jgi:hypothetical protein